MQELNNEIKPLKDLNLTDRFLFDEVMEDPQTQSYIIMIMPFDLFGYEQYRYTFRAVCAEVPECELGDGTVRIFLNTRGKNPESITPELAEFLHYLEHTTDKMAGQTESERIKRIHNRVCKVKANEEVGVRYMQAWEERYYDREEAREEGYKSRM